MSSPLYEKIIAKSDLIEIDGTDYSNAFSEFALSSEHSTEDVSGFSVTGVDETLPGNTAQGFTGQFFINSELASDLWDMHITRAVVPVSWQPNGLVDNTGPLWYGNCTLNVFNPSNTRGSASTSTLSATAADALGIHMINT
jgi:hypothetical protein